MAALDQGLSKRENVSVLLEYSVAKLDKMALQILTTIGLLAIAPIEREIIAKVLEITDGEAGRALGDLINYGLVVRVDNTYELSHPLIHAYAHRQLLATKELTVQQKLAERIILVLAELFPEVEYSNWAICESLLPHAQSCVELIDHYSISSPEAAYLLNQSANYLFLRAQYRQAEPLLIRALVLYEQELGSQHLDTAITLNNLAGLYQAQRRYEQAEPLLQRALAICEQTLGLNHPDTATSLHNLAELYRTQGRYTQAESFYKRALSASEKVLAPDHPDTAITLNNLAILYQAQRRYEQAEPLLQRALAIKEQVLGPDHPDTSVALKNYASLLRAVNRAEEAALLEKRVKTIRARTTSS